MSSIGGEENSVDSDSEMKLMNNYTKGKRTVNEIMEMEVQLMMRNEEIEEIEKELKMKQEELHRKEAQLKIKQESEEFKNNNKFDLKEYKTSELNISNMSVASTSFMELMKGSDADLISRQSELKRKEEQLEWKEEQMTWRSEELDRREEEIVCREHDTEKREEEMSSKEIVLHEKEIELESCGEELKNKEMELKAFERKIIKEKNQLESQGVKKGFTKDSINNNNSNINDATATDDSRKKKRGSMLDKFDKVKLNKDNAMQQKVIDLKRKEDMLKDKQHQLQKFEVEINEQKDINQTKNDQLQKQEKKLMELQKQLDKDLEHFHELEESKRIIKSHEAEISDKNGTMLEKKAKRAGSSDNDAFSLKKPRLIVSERSIAEKECYVSNVPGWAKAVVPVAVVIAMFSMNSLRKK